MIQGIDQDEIARLTEQYGGQWGLNHTRRLLQLISIIGADLKYEAEVLWVTAHLHDWGAYSPWAVQGVDHAVRSIQVAAQFLSERGCPESTARHIIECIEFHHSSTSDHSLEAILLRDADALDFLGIIGMARDFAKKPKDLRDAYETIKKRRNKLPGLIHLPKAKEMAAERVREMDAALACFECETFGCF